MPHRQAAVVGSSAFAHKAGLHAAAILKDPTTYEHIDPGQVGNSRRIPMSNQAGQSNLRKRLAEAGLEVGRDAPALGRILDRVKSREALGYSFDTAQASFELIARDELGLLPEFFEVKRYRVTVERRKNKRNQMVSLSEAVVVVKVDGVKMLSVTVWGKWPRSLRELGRVFYSSSRFAARGPGRTRRRVLGASPLRDTARPRSGCGVWPGRRYRDLSKRAARGAD